MSLLSMLKDRLLPGIDDELIRLFQLEQEEDLRYMRENLRILTDLEVTGNLPGGRGVLLASD